MNKKIKAFEKDTANQGLDYTKLTFPGDGPIYVKAETNKALYSYIAGIQRGQKMGRIDVYH